MIGLPEILIILIIILIVLGPKKLPKLARAIGQAVREYKKTVNESEPRKTRRRKRKPAG